MLKARLKFSKSCVNSLLIKPGQTNEDINITNTKSHHASAIVTEEIIKSDEIVIADHINTKLPDLLCVYWKEFLNEKIGKEKNDLTLLTKDLDSKILTENQYENENENPVNTTNVNINHNNVITQSEKNDVSLSALILPNLLDISAANNSTNTPESVLDVSTELFSNIKELNDLVKNKTIEIFATITTKIWDSLQKD